MEKFREIQGEKEGQRRKRFLAFLREIPATIKRQVEAEEKQ